MPPKRQFTKQEIVEKAFLVAKEEGLAGLTARKVAERLGSSVAPIYSNFADLDELKQAVVLKVAEVSRDLLKQQRSEGRFLDIGIASLSFAQEYSNLFRDLTLTENPYLRIYEQALAPDLRQLVAEDTSLATLPESNRAEVLLKMRIFQLGLSVMAANRLLPEEVTDQKQIDLLREVGNEVIEAAKQRH